MIVASLEERLQAEQAEKLRLQAECDRLRREAQDTASERDHLRSRLAEAERQRDNYRKGLVAYWKKEITPEDIAEMQRRLTEPTTPLSEVMEHIFGKASPAA